MALGCLSLDSLKKPPYHFKSFVAHGVESGVVLLHRLDVDFKDLSTWHRTGKQRQNKV